LPVHFMIEKLIDYDEFCGIKTPDWEMEVTPEQLAEMLESNVDFQLIDVRETHEYAVDNLGGQLMPLSALADFTGQISREKMVVIHCQSGVRSQKAIQQLLEQHGFMNLKNLKGGLAAFRKMHL